MLQYLLEWLLWVVMRDISLRSSALVNIAKGTTNPRVEFISQVQTQILIKFHLQNLDQASNSKSQPNIISIKLKLKNFKQTQLQNLDQDST